MNDVIGKYADDLMSTAYRGDTLDRQDVIDALTRSVTMLKNGHSYSQAFKQCKLLSDTQTTHALMPIYDCVLTAAFNELK